MLRLHIEGPEGPREQTVAGDTITLGRLPECEVVLPEATVSRRHARLLRSDGVVVVEDLGGSNGTVLDGRVLRGETAPLGANSAVAIGPYTIRVAVPSPEPQFVAIPRRESRRPVTIPPPPPPAPGPPRRAPGPLGRAQVSPAADRPSRLAPAPVTDGAKALGTAHAPDAIRVSVGRDPASDLVLDTPQVSRHHALFERATPSHPWTVTDLNSTNHTYVNGEAVGARRLGEGDVVRIGPYRLTVHGGALEQHDETRGFLIEALDLVKVVGKGTKILDGVSLVVRPGELVAVVGGTGAGKSTLLGALSGLRPATSGQVLLNGFPLYAHFDALRRQIGYVPQDDIIHKELTAGHALDYAAQLRMPADTTPAEREARVTQVLEELRLVPQRDTPIRNLSGGQRKRVSIGVELLTSPPLFFLDEPAAGLDPGAETRMMALLRQLADAGRTVVLITHATRNIAVCDKVCFLATGGRLVFYGPPREALDYFGAAAFEEIYDRVESGRPAAEWAEQYACSPQCEAEITAPLAYRRVAATAPLAALGAMPGTAAPPPAAEAWRQFRILTRRYTEIVLNDRKNLLILLAQAPIVALLLWALIAPNVFAPQQNVLVVAQLGNRSVPVQTDPSSGKLFAPPGATLLAFDLSQCRNPVGALADPLAAGCAPAPGNGNAVATKASILASILALTAVWLGTLNAIREISKEDAIYRRERRVNLSVVAYVGSKFAVLLALVLVQATILLGVTALHVAWPDFTGFAGTWLSLVLAGAASVAMALAISAAVADPDRAMFAAPIITLPQIFFCGLVTAVKDLGAAQPLAALVPARWTYEAIGRVTGIVHLAAIPPQFSQADALDGGAWSRWLVLLLFVAICGPLACVLQQMKDRR